MNAIKIEYNGTPIETELKMPGSKSLTNRALIIAAMAEGKTTLKNVLFSDDTIYMIEALEKIGYTIENKREKNTLIIDGGLSKLTSSTDKPIFIGNAGTAIRFLTAMLSLTNNHYELTGIKRMQERPIGELLDAITTLGGVLYSKHGNGCPPVIINGKGIDGGNVKFSGTISSQFISALLMTAPYSKNDVIIEISNEPVSKPYIEMTIEIMKTFGVQVETDKTYQKLIIKSNQAYKPIEYSIESDASSASYFFAAAAVTNGKVKIKGLTKDSIQGDIQFTEVLKKMGCTINSGPDWIEVIGCKQLHGVKINMKDISDTSLTLAAISIFADSPTEITDIANIRLKETDRIKALTNELTKIGAKVTEKPDGIIIYPAEQYEPAEIETYDDHRMAMSFAVAGLKIPGLKILNPECTSKTFPDFFKVFLKTIGEN